MIPPETSVVIVGGGPVGLVSSILLSLQGIDNVLFERQPDTSIHPKAVGRSSISPFVFGHPADPNRAMGRLEPKDHRDLS